MARRPTYVALLDSTITALEDLILTAPDKEILSAAPKGRRAAEDVQVLIQRKLTELGVSSSDHSAAAPLPTKKQRSSRRTGLKISLTHLRRLAASRPDLPPHLAAVFGSARTPTSQELDDLTEELIRLGVLSGRGPRSK